MRSSRDMNWPKKVGESFLQRSVFLALFGIPVVTFSSIHFKEVSGLFILGAIFVPFVLSQLAYGGGKPFPDYNLERFKIFLRRVLRADRFNVDVSHWEGASVKSIDHGVVYGLGGTETYGYKIILDPSSRVERFYQAFYQDLLKMVGQGVIIKDVVISQPFSNPYLKQHRPSLLAKGLCEQRRILFVTFEESCPKDDKRQILERLSLGTARLTTEEMAAYFELVAAPESPASGREMPTYQVSQVLDGKTIKMYPGEKRQAAISLCSLPPLVESDFNLILSQPLAKSGIITTTFKKREGFSESFKLLVEGFFKVSKIVRPQTAEEKKAREEEIDRENRGDKAKLHMYQSILMYDRPKALQERVTFLQNVRTRLNLSDEKTPIYMADEGFIEQSFKAALPSPWAYLPQRLQSIRSFEEASYYLPVESAIATGFSPLVFRSLRNTPYYVDVQDTADATVTLIVGGQGTGKSTLIGAYVDALDHLESEGIATGYVNIDLGSSSSFNKDHEDVLSFDLSELDESGDIAGYPIHPLHCALDPRKSSYTVDERNLAIKQIIKLLGLKSYTAIAEEIVSAALDQMIKYCDEYRLSNFRNFFLPLFKAKRESADLTLEVKMEWENAVSLLNKFCAASREVFGPWPVGVSPPPSYSAGEYAKVFDPDQTRFESLGDFKRLYFNLSLAQESIKDLARAHTNFAFMIGYAICLKYDSESGNYHLFHFYVDEFQKQSRHIDPTEFLDLKNQSRKHGFMPIIASQAFEHFVMDKLDKDKQKEIFKGIKDVYFGNISYSDDEEILKILLTVNDELLDEKLIEVRDTINRLQKVISDRKAAQLSEERSEYIEEALSTYSIGYISPTRDVENFYVDYEPFWLWHRTTHAAGRELRNKVMAELGLDRRAAARELLKIMPKVPSSKLSEEDIKKVVQKIREALDGEK